MTTDNYNDFKVEAKGLFLVYGALKTPIAMVYLCSYHQKSLTYD